jgi:hypothetical protein
MTRRERHIHILNRLKSPLGGMGYELFTDQELEQYARNTLWNVGLAKHNARAMANYLKQEIAYRANQNSQSPLFK